MRLDIVPLRSEWNDDPGPWYVVDTDDCWESGGKKYANVIDGPFDHASGAFAEKVKREAAE